MCVEPDPRRGISFSLVPYASSTGRFTTQWHRDQVVVIAAGGDLDATNAGALLSTHYVTSMKNTPWFWIYASWNFLVQRVFWR
ncbi:Putative sulfate transporter/antisigma-factor [Mycobacteroides abscessus]|nr:Putative sulfate transporter/antisigma-factor [Mycobacteroides abscessus]